MKTKFAQRVLTVSSRLLRPSLRLKVALVFITPVLFLVLLLSYSHYLRERSAVEDQIRLNATQLGDVVLGGLRQSMLVNDSTAIAGILRDIGRQGSIKRVWIIDLNRVVRQSSIPQEVGMHISTNDPGCIECHKFTKDMIPLVIETDRSPGNLRVATPIENLPQCQSCHPATNESLGILLVDASITGMQARLKNDFIDNLLMALAIALLGMISALALVNWLFINRVEVIHKALSAFELGEFSARVPKNWHTEDELTQLGDSFNGMADSIVEHEKKLHELASVRQQAIIEERERIARELHDGVAQFIGYANTKLSAARLLLQKNQVRKADENLAQIEHEVQNQALDVRASILGLRIVSQSGVGLAVSMRDYIDQCNRMSDFLIALEIEPGVKSISLGAEAELQLVRIVQEALSNVRKHASARQAEVRLSLENGFLLVSIRDNGQGFNPWAWSGDQGAHFGLQTMRERAEMVGASLSIESEPGKGTTVVVRLKLEES
jgi:signal transduction histidine kinase